MHEVLREGREEGWRDVKKSGGQKSSIMLGTKEGLVEKGEK